MDITSLGRPTAFDQVGDGYAFFVVVDKVTQLAIRTKAVERIGRGAVLLCPGIAPRLAAEGQNAIRVPKFVPEDGLAECDVLEMADASFVPSYKHEAIRQFPPFIAEAGHVALVGGDAFLCFTMNGSWRRWLNLKTGDHSDNMPAAKFIGTTEWAIVAEQRGQSVVLGEMLRSPPYG